MPGAYFPDRVEEAKAEGTENTELKRNITLYYYQSYSCIFNKDKLLMINLTAKTRQDEQDDSGLTGY